MLSACALTRLAGRVTVSLALASPLPAGASSFLGIGTTTGMSHSTKPMAVTPDHQVILAQACAHDGFDSPCMPFTWTLAGGAVAQPLLPADTYGVAFSLSDDGSRLAGLSQNSPTSHFGRKALLWVDGGAPSVLAVHSDSIAGWARFISADGAIVAGTRTDASQRQITFAWTEAGGVLDLLDPSLPSFVQSPLAGMSRDGVIVANLRNSSGSLKPVRVIRWTPAGGVEMLAPLPAGYTGSEATMVASDSGAIAGTLWESNLAASPGRAHRWTESSGFEPLPLPPGVLESRATHISRDGTNVAGYFVNTTPGALEFEAFHWDETTGTQSLGAAPGFERTRIAVLDNDALLLGRMDWNQVELVYDAEHVPDVWQERIEQRAFFWSPTSGRIDLPHPDLSPECDHDFWTQAEDMPDDGSIILARSRCDEPDSFYETFVGGSWSVLVTSGERHEGTFVWDAANGFRTLDDYVATEHGVDLTGWELLTASVSDDGQLLTGLGLHDGHQEGWVLYVPEPGMTLQLASGCGLLAVLSKRRRRR
jgi:hypothetical protein